MSDQRAIAPRAGLRILVVDDNVPAADSLATILRLWEHRPSVVYDGISALERCLEEPPDLVLLDIDLPGIDGFEVAHHLREALIRPPAIVSLSGYDPERDFGPVPTSLFDDHLVKPVDFEALARILEARAALEAEVGSASATARHPVALGFGFGLGDFAASFKDAERM